MIDNFSILLSHALLAIALWRLMNRADLDFEDPPVPEERPAGFAVKTRVKSQQANASSDA